MSDRPLVVDLYCGAGGAGKGYQDAGFDVEGFDVVQQPNYPYGFTQGSALSMLAYLADKALAGLPVTLYGRPVALFHTSPPCQASCTLTKGTNKGRRYVDLIPVTRELLKLTGVPYVIENVQGSKVRRDLTLCGEMFGLEVIRHRYFEVDGLSIPVPEHKPHRGRVRGWRHGEFFDGPYFAVYGDGGGKGSVAEWQRAMGMPWTDVRLELAEAIPPAYTNYIGEHAIQQLQPLQKEAA